MSSCGGFDPGRDGDLLTVPGYLGGELPDGQNLFDIDPLFKSGFASLAADGLELEDNLGVAPDQALAYLTATNIVNHVWKELLGHPLTLAHSFPRNEKQREILQTLTTAFVADDYSLRTLLTEIAVHPYFNIDAPDLCDTSTPYFLEPVFEPYSITTADPTRRGNNVGDRVQRFSAWVLIESAMRAMWWDLPVGQIPAQENNYPALDFLRDTGVFLKDAQNGFNGVDFNGLLAWENRLANGTSPGLGGECTGPLGQPCSQFEWIELMLDTAFKTPGTTVADVAAAIKDRLITEPEIADDGELEVIAAIMGLDPASKMERPHPRRPRGGRPPLRRPPLQHPPVHALRRPQPRSRPRRDPQVRRPRHRHRRPLQTPRPPHPRRRLHLELLRRRRQALQEIITTCPPGQVTT
jgi:hypothetical protein